MADNSNRNGLTVEMVNRAMDAIKHARMEPEPLLVHHREWAWIKEPEGSAPTLHAINVALTVGAITMESPEAQRLMREFRGSGDTEKTETD